MADLGGDMQKLFCYLVISTLFSVVSAKAAWYQGEGQALIVDGEVAKARQLAVQDALLSVMYQGGASVSTVQQVKDGVLEKHLLSMRSKGEVQDMRLLKESIEGNIIKVLVSADIVQNLCDSDKYAKTLFVGPFQLQKREHGQLGAVYRLPEELARRYFYAFKKSSQYVDVRHLRTRQIAFSGQRDNDIEGKMLSVASDIANQYDVQYILFAEVSDISSFNEMESELLIFENSVKKRNYQIRLYVVDGIKGVTVFRKYYVGKQPWPFDITMKLDVTGNLFWSSEYGRMITSLIEESTVDIQKTLNCSSTIATVKNVYQDKVVINLGLVNGVKKGDQFRLVREQFISEQPNNHMQGIFNPAQVIFTVENVQSDRSILTTSEVTGLDNVQIRDRLIAVERDYFDKTVYNY